MYEITQVSDVRYNVATPIGDVQVYLMGSNYPSGKPWHIVTMGISVASVEAARDWLAAQDWRDPTADEVAQNEADSRINDRYWASVEAYACGERD